MISTRKNAKLTAREREILRHVAIGCSNATVAERLCISTYTVRNHLSNIFDKLGARSRWHAVALVFGQRPLNEIFDVTDSQLVWSPAPEPAASPEGPVPVVWEKSA